MKIAICDDSIEDVIKVQALLKAHNAFADSEIDTYTSSKDVLDDINKGKKIDIAFLDVDMPYMNGLELGKELRKTQEKLIIVFVSAYSRYAVRAFDCEAFSYLMKPIDNENEATSVLDRLYEKYVKQTRFHTVRINTEYRRLSIPDIRYVECCNKHIIYHMEDGICETTERLSDVYDVLKDYGFYQAHQGYIINFDKISRFVKYSVILDDGKELPVSMRRKTDMMLAYSKYAEVHYR